MVPENTDDPARRREGEDPPPDALPIPTPDGETLSEEEDLESGHDFSHLLQPFDDAQDLDDQVASELDPGVDLSEVADLPEEIEQPLVDLSEMVDEPSEMRSAETGADEFGPTEDAGGFDSIDPIPETNAVDDADGVVDDSVITTELGELGSDEEEEELPRDLVFGEIGITLEEEPSRPAVAWGEVKVAAGHERTLVAAFRGRVVAAGSDVSTLDDSGAVTRLVLDTESTVTSILSTPDGTFFYTTARGELFRVDPHGRERIKAWADVFDSDPSARALELGGMTPSSRPAILLRAARGRQELLESTDQGSTFRRVDLGGEVIAISKGSPPLCAVKTGKATRLLRSEPTGGFSTTNAAVRSDAETLTLAVHGDTIAVLDTERGVQLSIDGGRTFRDAEGVARATAISAGLVGGRPVVFAALFDEAVGATKIAHVDAASAEVTIVASVDSSDDEESDFARVASLAWNEHTETLWAAGTFGLRCWRRPPSA